MARMPPPGRFTSAVTGGTEGFRSAQRNTGQVRHPLPRTERGGAAGERQVGCCRPQVARGLARGSRYRTSVDWPIDGSGSSKPIGEVFRWRRPARTAEAEVTLRKDMGQLQVAERSSPTVASPRSGVKRIGKPKRRAIGAIKDRGMPAMLRIAVAPGQRACGRVPWNPRQGVHPRNVASMVTQGGEPKVSTQCQVRRRRVSGARSGRQRAGSASGSRIGSRFAPCRTDSGAFADARCGCVQAGQGRAGAGTEIRELLARAGVRPPSNSP